jgi:hypothetical protein
MKTQKSENNQFKILTIPKETQSLSATYPGIDEPTHQLFDELRDRIESQGKTFKMRRFKDPSGYGTIIGRSDQIVVFLEYQSADRPDLFYVFVREIRSVTMPKMFAEEFQNRNQTPPAVPLDCGLRFTLTALDDGYYLECLLPPARGKITYESDAKAFAQRYPALDPQARRKRAQEGGGKDDDGAGSSLELRPRTDSEPRP